MSTVLAKFLVSGVNAVYEAGHDGDVAFLQSAHIKLSAVQGEPFGPYTPFGVQEMTIMNPAAAAVFVKPYQEYMERAVAASRAGQSLMDIRPPEFYVTFHLDEGKGAVDLANH